MSVGTREARSSKEKGISSQDAALKRPPRRFEILLNTVRQITTLLSRCTTALTNRLKKMNDNRSDQDGSFVFADEKARIVWEIGQAVSRFSATLPPENQSLNAQQIRFDPEHSMKGACAIIFSGTVIGTGQEGVFLVPERSLIILRKLGVPYHVV